MNEKAVTEEKSLFWHRMKLLGLIGIFLLPFIAGWLALYVFELKPESGNYGSLVQPVKKVAWPAMKSLDGQVYQDGFGRKWSFILISRDRCSQVCRSNLFYMRQIRTLLGRDAQRLQNIYISATGIDDDLSGFLKEYPDLLVFDRFSNESLLSQFRVDEISEDIGSTPRLYLVDPDQNYMM
ncbi:MAG: hypothetical protein HKN34_09320, partial [Gammaproteobacteria bacterium]|nr:hypothetical protein [Gammaproteobacteria bacterium]